MALTITVTSAVVSGTMHLTDMDGFDTMIELSALSPETVKRILESGFQSVLIEQARLAESANLL